jgi:hypothetical protein
MDNVSTSDASGRCAQVLLWPSVRTYFTSSVAVASAGILALGLVVAPPDVPGARSEDRAVQLVALTLPSTAPSAAILEKFVRNQAQTSALVTRVVQGGGAADINTDATAPLAFVRVGQPTGSPTQAVRTTAESTIDPAIERQLVNDSASVATTGDSLGTLAFILALPFIVVVTPFAFAFFALLFVVSFIQGAIATEAIATAAPLASDPILSDSARVTTATEVPADAKPATEAGKADVSPPVTSIDKRARTEPVTSKKDVTETVEVEEESTEPTAVKASESSASDSTSETAKPAGRPETPRPVVRDSLGSGKQLSEQSHPGNGGSTADDEPTTAGSSSVASSSHGSSSKGSRSSDGDSSDSDAGGSE